MLSSRHSLFCLQVEPVIAEEESESFPAVLPGPTTTKVNIEGGFWTERDWTRGGGAEQKDEGLINREGHTDWWEGGEGAKQNVETEQMESMLKALRKRN